MRDMPTCRESGVYSDASLPSTSNPPNLSTRAFLPHAQIYAHPNSTREHYRTVKKKVVETKARILEITNPPFTKLSDLCSM